VALDLGTPVELAVAQARLIVTPWRQQYRMDDLVAGITSDNCHDERF
jgi:hypothetical protein